MPDLRSIRSFDQLVRYLGDELDWPVGDYELEDLIFTYEPAELGLKPDDSAQIKAIHQLRPLHSGQPWGIFFVEFEKKKLPVVVLRRILSHLVVKKRASANKADAKRWDTSDILFISAFGDEGATREIAFAHFHSPPDAHEKPVLRVLGWHDATTPMALDYVHATLKSRLTWPDDTADADAWREQWSGAFRHGIAYVIKTTKELAGALAELAKGIRANALAILESESDRGPLQKELRAFKDALIHDLDEESFADMYAQTITYGLFTAANSRTPPDADSMSAGERTAVTSSDLAAFVPRTNPFLKETLERFLVIGGRKDMIDFDELGIHAVVDLLNDPKTDLAAVRRDFNSRRIGEDPVIHFYESFLAAYNKKLRFKRGVFYTPQPVVSYIVRSVHELLQTEFGLEDGLADTTTWGEFRKKREGEAPPEPKLSLPPLTDEPGEKRTISPDEPFVQILDPATGTATFLVEVIDVIHKHLEAKWKKGGASAMPTLSGLKSQPSGFKAYWNEYIPKALLPRLHAFELMMAPYAIAHMKIGLKLAETGYRFVSEERARIYLTNALEPWVTQLPLIGFDALAHEAAAVNEIKRHKRFTVVIGNPPYSGVSSNNSEHAIRLADAYKIIDGGRLNEKKLWLQDDYVKFLRTAQMTVERARCGVLGFITNHGYLDNPTFRGMRQSLLNSFQWRQFVDLHGNAKKKEVAPDGTPDVNVFDIQQGVAVGLFVKRFQVGLPNTLTTRGDLFGSREGKYRALASASLHSLPVVNLQPSSPFYLFVQQDQTNRKEFEAMLLLSDITQLHSVGVVTARDHLTLAFTSDEIWDRVQRFAILGVEAAREEFELRDDVRDWKVSLAQADLRSAPLSKKLVKPILYRPFDTRFIYYTGKNKGFIGQPAAAVMSHMVAMENVGLMTTRKVEVGTFGHAICSRIMTESHSVSLKEVNYLFPLWLCPDERDLAFSKDKRPNLTPQFLRAFAGSLGVKQQAPHGLPVDLTPEDIFHYTYAVFHSPGYRSRYAEFLKIDFPRLPLTGNLDLFRALALLGGELTALHLLESPKLDHPITEFIGSSKEVIKVGYTDETVWINAGGTKGKTTAGTSGFRGVHEAVWNFHIGGYQVCEKWLKDRNGRMLTKDDVAHYQKIVIALNETIRLMSEIDQVIEKHGGWPCAFQPKV